MRFILLIIFSSMCLSVSAQWYRLDLKLKKHERPAEALGPLDNHSVQGIKLSRVSNSLKLDKTPLPRTEMNYEAVEMLVMRTAQHNMRFRVYNDASYNFSDLARMYIKQNRYAEAKWFLLQSNIISRNENDDRHTIANLIDLSTIKAGLGDYDQAQADLSEAHDLALQKGFKEDLSAISKKILALKQNRFTTPKVDVRYAEAPPTNAKAE